MDHRELEADFRTMRPAPCAVHFQVPTGHVQVRPTLPLQGYTVAHAGGPVVAHTPSGFSPGVHHSPVSHQSDRHVTFHQAMPATFHPPGVVHQMPPAMPAVAMQGGQPVAMLPGQVMQPKAVQRVASGPVPMHSISLMKAATHAAMVSPRLMHLKKSREEDESPMMRKAKSEQAPQITGIIKKFEQAMSQQSESTRSSSLMELEGSGHLGDLSHLQRGRSSPVVRQSSSVSSLRFGGILSRASTVNSMPLTVRSPKSFKEVVRQTSQPSLKAQALASTGGSPRSPRSPSPRSRAKQGVTRSASANIGLLEGRFGRNGVLSPRLSPQGSDNLEDTIQSMRSLGESTAELATSLEEYKNASQRVPTLQSQMVRVATDSPQVQSVPEDDALEDDEDFEASEVEVVKVRSLRESTRLASKRILPLGGIGVDSDGEDSPMADGGLKVVETGVITNEGRPTSPHATQFS